MTIKRSFTKEQMLEVLDDEDLIISNEIYDQRRWVTCYELIFKHEDKFYRTTYDRGSTEYQDEGPWENDEEVVCIEVHPVQKTITVYENLP